MKRIALAASLALAAAPVEAQIIRPPRGGEPRLWVSFSPGLFQSQSVLDGRTNTAWDFSRSSALALRGSLELAMRGGATFGVVGSYINMPMQYFSGLEGPGGPAPECQPCDAHAKVMSLGGLFHMGGGDGLHQVIEVSAGVTRYRDFTTDDGGRSLPPESDTDLSFVIGYGFGYSMSPRLRFALVQDYGVTVHQGEGLSNNAGTTSSQRVTRLGVRMGLGARRGGFRR